MPPYSKFCSGPTVVSPIWLSILPRRPARSIVRLETAILLLLVLLDSLVICTVFARLATFVQTKPPAYSMIAVLTALRRHFRPTTDRLLISKAVIRSVDRSGWFWSRSGQSLVVKLGLHLPGFVPPLSANILRGSASKSVMIEITSNRQPVEKVVDFCENLYGGKIVRKTG